MHRCLPFLLLTIPALAQAQTNLVFEVQSKVLIGEDTPALRVTAEVEVRGLKVSMIRADGRTKRFPPRTLRAGQTGVFAVDAEPGRTDWRAEIIHAGMKEPEILTFTAVVGRPMRIRISKDTVDLADGKIAFVASEPVASVKLTITGEGGRILVDQETPATTPANGQTVVAFAPPNAVVTRIVMQALDPDGFFSGVEIAPFYVEVPHEEVIFEFGKADIVPTEEPKLRRTQEAVREALKKFGNELKANLYVAGYTDTVGSRDYNQDLSSRRALSIAHWFKTNGLEIRVCHQGFGEDAPVVGTPDETPEPRNRRTLHVLANQGITLE